METITQLKSAARIIRPSSLTSSIASILWCVGSAALAQQPSSMGPAASAYAEPAASMESLPAGQKEAPPTGEALPTGKASSRISPTTNGKREVKHDAEISLPQPGVPLTLFAVLLLMGLIGKRRSGKSSRIASTNR